MGNTGQNIHLRSSAVSNVGRVRSHNEDSVHLWPTDHTPEDVLIAIVADGMGGAAAGEEASRMAVETIMQQLVDVGTPPSHLELQESALRSAVSQANLFIMQEAIAQPQNRGMGTTLTMVYVKGRQALFAHVGDSRAYRVKADGNIEQITSDHSFVQALLDAGHITAEQAEIHPMRNVLYRALGQTRDLDIDTYRANLATGDYLILCSDGLTGHVRAKEIAEVTREFKTPNQISHQLVKLANERGGEDNISVIVIHVETLSPPLPQTARLDASHVPDDMPPVPPPPNTLPETKSSQEDTTSRMERWSGQRESVDTRTKREARPLPQTGDLPPLADSDVRKV